MPNDFYKNKMSNSLFFQYSYFQSICFTSVGNNTLFMIASRYSYSFDFDTKLGQFHEPPPVLEMHSSDVHGIYFDEKQQIKSCACHIEKKYQRYA